MAVLVCHQQQQQLAGARGGETSTSKSASATPMSSTFPSRRVPRCGARRCSTARLVVMAVSSPASQGLSAATDGSTAAAVEAATAPAATPTTRVVVEATSLPLAIVVEPSIGGDGGDGQFPPSEGGDGSGDGDGGDGRRKFSRFNLIAG